MVSNPTTTARPNTFTFVLRTFVREPRRPLPPVPPQSQNARATDRLPVSVVIPAFNRADLLPQTLRSVDAQRPQPPGEVIVVDDGSTDSTAEIAAAWGARVVRHESNQGLSAARNSGIAAASNEWVALLDSDDVWLPHHLATLWPHRTVHDVVAASALRFGAAATHDRFHGPVGRRVLVLDSPAPLAFPGNFVCVSAAMVRKSAVEAVGGFQPRDGLVADLDLWIRLLNHGSVVVIPVVTINYRLHEHQMSQDRYAMQDAHLAAAAAHAGVGPVDVERWRGGAIWDNLRASLRSNDWRGAIAEAASAMSRFDRVVGLFGTWLWRFLVRRRGSEVDRDGWPSIAVLPNSPAAKVLPELAKGRRLKVTHYSSVIRAAASLAGRPAGVLFIGSPAQRTIARLLAAHACGDPEEARALFPAMQPTSAREEHFEQTPSVDLLTQ